MTGEEYYAIWAPDDSTWSRWVRPVVFAQLDTMDLAAIPADAASDGTIPAPPAPARGTAIIIDLAGSDAVRAGVHYAQRGYRPVPLFNGTHGPAPLIDVRPMARELVAGAAVLRGLRIDTDAPPVFLLDANRMTPTPVAGQYDNRWVVLPQDFPSATFLRARGIERLLLVQRGVADPAQDLAHVLMRWQEGGIVLEAIDATSPGATPRSLRVQPPAWYRKAAYALIAFFGLRRANVGGFGGMIPEQTTTGSGFA